MAIKLYQGDLPAGLDFGECVAVDCETMGLNPARDRLCLIQLSAGDGDCHLVQFAQPKSAKAGVPYDAPRLKALSVLTESPYAKMHVRAQRSCWGSRSCSGTVSLNLCLLFLAPELLRYLLIHELCHGRHMNHSKRFWKRVARFEPEYRSRDRALTESWRQVPGWLGLY
ncbi:MAG: DUF45 domain-containing protein [Chloroflexi bacterium]|nr:DUF45 domain-containing protein [Chloroflexota bacterium]